MSCTGFRLRGKLFQCNPVSGCYPTRYFDFSLKILIASNVNVEKHIDTMPVITIPIGSICVFNQNLDKYSFLPSLLIQKAA